MQAPWRALAATRYALAMLMHPPKLAAHSFADQGFLRSPASIAFPKLVQAVRGQVSLHRSTCRKPTATVAAPGAWDCRQSLQIWIPLLHGESLNMRHLAFQVSIAHALLLGELKHPCAPAMPPEQGSVVLVERHWKALQRKT